MREHGRPCGQAHSREHNSQHWDLHRTRRYIYPSSCCSCDSFCDRRSGQFSHWVLHGMGGLLDGQNRLHVSLDV